MPGRTKSTLFLTIFVLALLALIPLLYFFSSVDTPGVRLAENIPLPGDGEGVATTPAMQVEITPDNVQSVIATLARTESYSRRIVQTRYWADGDAYGTAEAEIWVTPGAVRIEWDHGENMILAGGFFHLWFGDGAPQSNRMTVRPGATLEQVADEFQGIPSYESLLELPRDQIIDAGYVRRPVGGVYEYCIFIVFADSALGYIDRYYISLTSGLLVAIETWDGDIPVFRMETLSLSLVAPDRDVFTLPDGTNVLG